MAKQKRTPAPIDNKNICTDFADVLHGGEYVEQVIDGRHVQLFFFEGKPFSLFYRFGTNMFFVECLRPLDDATLIGKVRNAVNKLNTNHVRVVFSDCAMDKIYTLTGQLSFIEK